MTQNLPVTPGSGATVAADLVGGALMQQIKINLGATNTDGGLISATNPLPMASPIPTIATSSAYAHTATTTAYAFGQLWANNATAGSVTFPTINVAKANDQASTIIGGYLSKSGNSTTNAIFRIHLFTAAPTTAVADRGAFQANLTLANWVGALDGTVNQSGSDVSIGALAPSIGSIIASIPLSGAQTLVWVPEVRAVYTPLSAETLTLTLWMQ